MGIRVSIIVLATMLATLSGCENYITLDQLKQNTSEFLMKNYSDSYKSFSLKGNNNQLLYVTFKDQFNNHTTQDKEDIIFDIDRFFSKQWNQLNIDKPPDKVYDDLDKELSNLSNKIENFTPKVYIIASNYEYKNAIQGLSVHDRKNGTTKVMVDPALSGGTESKPDTESTIAGKDGNDWGNLTQNEKFHAISNILYGIEQNGHTITETEQYYIDALDSFYSGNGTKSTTVKKALAIILGSSGTLK